MSTRRWQRDRVTGEGGKAREGSEERAHEIGTPARRGKGTSNVNSRYGEKDRESGIGNAWEEGERVRERNKKTRLRE
jgi:hypothetical protein